MIPDRSTPRVPEMFIFGTQDFKNKVYDSIKQGAVLQRFPSVKENKMEFILPDNQTFGSVYMDFIGENYTLLVYENTTHDHTNPWEFKVKEHDFVFKKDSKLSNIQNFENLVKYFKEIEEMISEFVVEQFDTEYKEGIPKGLTDLLEYELFIGLSEVCDHFEFNLVVADVFKGNFDNIKTVIIPIIRVVENSSQSVFFKHVIFKR